MSNTYTSGLRHKNTHRRTNAPIAAKKPHDIIPALGDSIRIIPLGGVEEIGKNMTVIEFKNDIIVVDAGIQFTDDDTPGVDYILPNIKYLEDRKDRIRALVITHGHLDHIGDIVNTGDVRVENENGVPAEKEVEQYKMFKDRKVLLFTMDSTGIDKSGFSPSETSILKNIDSIVATAPGRVILATFASQVERIVEFLKTAKRYGRKVLIEGRSMKTNVEIIKHLNLVETDHIVPIEDIEKYPPNKILMVATGAQGEEFAALMRMSNKTHKFIRLQRSDTIILSSSVIPGNDKAVEKLKDNLFRHDAKIITYLDSDVHTSGHGKRGELEWVHKQIPYKYFMPVHGNHFRLKMHAELAASLGCPLENI